MRAFMAIRCQVSARHSGPSDVQHRGPPRLRLADYVAAARNSAQSGPIFASRTRPEVRTNSRSVVQRLHSERRQRNQADQATEHAFPRERVCLWRARQIEGAYATPSPVARVRNRAHRSDRR